ncbi:hypothetical protein FTX61_20455 [Nitriliruptoraceae bacterium ZYF776]|nr:hypothetical protein [Profundirhabdus halotolerans]
MTRPAHELPATRWNPAVPATADTTRSEPMNVIRMNVPPDQTPAEEAALVADVAAAYTDSTGSADVTVEVHRSEEVDFRAVQAGLASRWVS